MGIKILKDTLTWEDVWTDISQRDLCYHYTNLYSKFEYSNKIRMYHKLCVLDESQYRKIDTTAKIPEHLRKIVKNKNVEEFMTSVKKTIDITRFRAEKKREREKAERLRKEKLIKVNDDIEKALIADGLFEGIEKIFSLNNNTQKRKNYSIFQSEAEIYDYIGKYNLIDYLGLKVKEKERFDCLFMSGMKAWIGRDEKGHFRYFTKNQKDDVLIFDIFNLVKMCTGLGFMDAVRKTKKEFKIKTRMEDWLQMQYEKYDDNVNMIKKAGNCIQPKYPILHEYIDKYWFLLQEMNIIGRNWTMECNQVEGEAVFFAPVKYIEKFYSECNPRTISRAINMLVAVGLIEKIPTSEIPRQMLEIFYNKAEMHEYYKNEINCYSVPAMTPKILKEAERRVKKLMKNNMTVRTLDYDKLKKVFGEELAKNVFPNHTEKTNAEDES